MFALRTRLGVRATGARQAHPLWLQRQYETVFLLADRLKPDHALGPFLLLVRATFRTNFVHGKSHWLKPGGPGLRMLQKIRKPTGPLRKINGVLGEIRSGR